MDFIVYTLEDKDGHPVEEFFYTEDYQEAKAMASVHRARVIANEYSFDDSYMVEDFTDDGTEDSDS